MPTLRSAAALLAAASSAAATEPLAAFAGCDGAPSPLDRATCETLGVPRDFLDARVAPGSGTLRALLLELRGPRGMREAVAHLAARLSARSPHMLWLAIVSRPASREVALAAWLPGGSRPRVAALVVSCDNVVDSDAETLCGLAAAGGDVDVLTHARWVGVLGRDAVTRRFYRTLERLVDAMAMEARGRAAEAERRQIALLYVSRLLFLSFLEAKEWLDGDRAFLARRFDDCMEAGGGYQRRVLLPLFFGTLNTPLAQRAAAARALGRIPFLNGGLFARTAPERVHADLVFRDEELGRLLSELLGRFRFTVREEATDWSEAAIDPEMLGRAFESLMAPPERRASGAFFTPHELVSRVSDGALRAVLAGAADRDVVDAALAGRWPPGALGAGVRNVLAGIRLLDPACGSGAFLVHALERVAALLGGLGDGRPTAELRHAVLRHSIFGVDVNPTAVWLCQLRLWLSVVIESHERDPSRVAALPNIDRHVRAGDALAGGDFSDAGGTGAPALRAVRDRYARAVGARKRTLARVLDRQERARAINALDHRIACLTAERRDRVLLARARDLFGERRLPAREAAAAIRRLREELRNRRRERRALASGAPLPFSFAAHFADIGAAGGFDAVIGNPPWVRVHRIPSASRATLRRAFRSYRHAAWQAGATAARAGAGFGGQVDLATLFVERSLALVRPGGAVALLVPSKLWRSLAGGGLRRLVAERHRLLAIEDWSDAPALFDAAVYPSMALIRRPGEPEPSAATDGERTVQVCVNGRRAVAAWDLDGHELPLDPSPGAPWLLLPPQARRAFDLCRRAGVPFAETVFGSPMLGIKCGFNEAFVIGDHVRRPTSVRPSEIEPHLLRPLVRGESLRPWRCERGSERIIWTHGPDGRPLERLPPHAERWFRRWRRHLSTRSDARHAPRWWSLFRTAAAAPDAARVVWADFGRAPRAAVLPPGDPTVPLNTCYVTRCADLDDAFALVAILNSALAAAWLDPLAEPARGGYRRYLGWTVSLLPLPADWERARALLAPVGSRAFQGEPPGSRELFETVTRAYAVRPSALTPLLEWHGR